MNRNVTYKNIKYGMLVEVFTESGYHAGCTVHFFNHKGVLIGNYYKFVCYEKLRFRSPYENGGDRNYPRNFMDEKFEALKDWFFIHVCNIVTWLIKFTQSFMHKF